MELVEEESKNRADKRMRSMELVEEESKNRADKRMRMRIYRQASMDGYNACHRLCTQFEGIYPHDPTAQYAQLRTQFGDTIRQFLLRSVLPALRNSLGELRDDLSALRDHVGPLFLDELLEGQRKHSDAIRWILFIFRYCDKNYRPLHYSLPTLDEVGEELFSRLILSEMKEGVVEVVGDMINKERDGGEINQQLIKQCVNLYETAPGMFPDFEEMLVQSTKKYCHLKLRWWIDEGATFLEYMINARTVLEAEKQRARSYLKPETQKRLVGAAEHEILRSEVVLLGRGRAGALVLLWLFD